MEAKVFASGAGGHTQNGGKGPQNGMESHSRGVGVSKQGVKLLKSWGGDPRMKAKPLVSSGGPQKTCLGMAEGPPKMVWKAAHKGWDTPKIDVKLLASPKTGSKPLVRSKAPQNGM